MVGSDTDVVLAFLEATDAKEWETVLDLLAEDVVIRNSSGKLYVGSAGFSQWLRDTAVKARARWFETASVSDLGDGFVLVVGAEHCEPIRGVSEASPGAWIYAVRDGRIVACQYFRTEADARESLPAPRGGLSPVATVRAIVEAVNEGDDGALVGMISADHRFVSQLVDPGTVNVGLGAVALHVARIRSEYEEVAFEESQFDDLGGGLVLIEALQRTRSRGRTARLRRYWLARVEDGRLVEWAPYESTEAARAAAAALLSLD